MSASSAPEADELQYLKSQNTQLWKVITKQKSVIHKLQRETARLLAERDELNQKLEALDSHSKKEDNSKPLTASPELVPIPDISTASPEDLHKDTLTSTAVNDSPVPPPRSPYRQNSTKDEARNDVHTIKPTLNAPIKVPLPEDRKPVPEPLILSNSPPSPVPDALSPRKAIIDKDAQLFAEFNASLMKRERQMPPTSLVNTTFPRDYQKEAEQVRQEALKRTGISTSDDDSEPSAMVSPTSIDETSGTVTTTESITPSASTSETASNSYSPSPELSTSTRNPLPMADHRQPHPNDPSGMSDEVFASLSVKVIASKIKSNEKKKEVLCFIISVGRIPQAQMDTKLPENQFEELWRVEKLYSDFINLDAKMRSGAIGEKQKHSVKFPEKSLFNTLSPSKVDQRKIALQRYLQQLISTPLDRISDICEFLSTDVIQQEEANMLGYKEGYLTKRGKNFGGWKRRYFVIDNHHLKYYDTKKGTYLGSIQLRNAKIGRQAPQTSTDTKDSKLFRHAFLVLEHKKSVSTALARHILCAQSDAERDEWIDALIHHVNVPEDEPDEELVTPSKDFTMLGKIKKLRKSDKRHKSANDFPNNNDSIPVSRKTFEISTSDDTRFSDPPFGIKQQRSNSDPAVTPMMRAPARERLPFRPSKSRLNSNDEPLSNDSGIDYPDPSGNEAGVNRNSMSSIRPTKGDSEHQIWNSEETSESNQIENDSLAAPSMSTSSSRHSRSAKRLTSRVAGWGKKVLSAPESAEDHESPVSNVEEVGDQMNPLQFGIPLEQAISATRSTIPCELPALVYRCIEYLDAKDAVLEEGIYRQSGSTAVINELREKFDAEGDYNILESGIYYDIHAVAGLLKLWLRELPTEVLTIELHNDFLCVIDLLDPEERLRELGRLISLLPVANYTLLRALSAHILQVVQNASVNKMSILNIGIVFALTLGIPGSILNMVLTEYDYVFWTNDEAQVVAEETHIESKTLENDEEVEKALKSADNFKLSPNMLSVFHGDGLRNNRNSMIFSSGAPNAIKHIEKNLETTQPMLLSDDDDEGSGSIYSSDNER